MRTLVAALVLSCLVAPLAAANEELADGIAAQVGTDIVLVSEVERIVAEDERRLREAGAPESEIARLRADGLETMIEWRLIEHLVTSMELFATDEEIDQAISVIAQENGISPEMVRKSVTSQDMSWEDYRSQIKRELERRKVVNALVASRVHVEEEDVKKLYKERFGSQPEGGTQVHVRQILVPGGEATGRTVAEACALTARIREELARGGSWSELAAKYSATAPQQAGDIGWLHERMLAGWMLQVLEPLEPGNVSQVVELPFGCTLLNLVERKEFEPVTYEQAKQRLAFEVHERQLAKEYREWMEELRQKTFIERRGYFADAAEFNSSPFDKYRAKPDGDGSEPAEDATQVQ